MVSNRLKNPSDQDYALIYKHRNVLSSGKATLPVPSAVGGLRRQKATTSSLKPPMMPNSQGKMLSRKPLVAGVTAG